MNILGIETSCDETSIAIVHNGTKVLCNYISSSYTEFLHTGGVIPEIAARKQIEFIPQLIAEILQKNIPIDAIAYTSEPGLKSSLLVGKSAAHTLAAAWNVPIIPVHHIYGHMCSIQLERSTPIPYPILTISLSGGHSEIWLRTDKTVQKKLGTTRDDAIGEAFDKAATLLGLPYPGGPEIAALAKHGNNHAFAFPNPLHKETLPDFSFSGLKTALKTVYNAIPKDMQDVRKADIAASFQHALAVHTVSVLQKSLEVSGIVHEIHIVGGVAANTYLVDMCRDTFSPLTICTPVTLSYCTDNAAMIAAAGYNLQRS